MQNAVKHNQTAEAASIMIPAVFFEDTFLCALSNESKILYALMLHRVSCSEANGWRDSSGRVYIIMTVAEVMTKLNVGKGSAVKALAELEDGGLIEKERLGMGKPNLIYVKDVSRSEDEKTEHTDAASDERCAEEKQRSSESEHQEVHNSDRSTYPVTYNSITLSGITTTSNSSLNNQNTDIARKNKNNRRYTKPLQLSHPIRSQDLNERYTEYRKYRKLLKERIDFDKMTSAGYWQSYRSEVEELLDVALEGICSQEAVIRVNKTDVPQQLFKARMLKLKWEHMEYVLHCLHETTTKVRSVKAYMRTCLYNAPSTISTYTSLRVHHDMYGSSED